MRDLLDGSPDGGVSSNVLVLFEQPVCRLLSFVTEEHTGWIRSHVACCGKPSITVNHLQSRENGSLLCGGIGDGRIVQPGKVGGFMFTVGNVNESNIIFF
eukprot:Lithocolla_globosa_v1_NODE_5515_length_1227_cov_68.407502.p3 type:complete len:100 gc:universal NODE_5515_length_1227_cov_68.407502:725-1024(+)